MISNYQTSDSSNTSELFIKFSCSDCKEIVHSNDLESYQVYILVDNSLEYEALVSLYAAERQNKYYDYIKSLFNSSFDSTQDLKDIADKLGMNIDKFNSDTNDQTINKLVQDTQEYIKTRGIEKFPTIIINNKIVE